MRPVRYSAAMSLDGYIAGPGGEFDWIPMDPAIDFAAFFRTIDTVLMGRRTFEIARQQGRAAGMAGLRTFVFSETLDPRDFPDVNLVAGRAAAATVAALRAEGGKDIWLMGGGVLFRSLLESGLVDTVEVAVIPTLLGRGIPLLPPTTQPVPLALTRTERFPSGIVALSYGVRRDSASSRA